MTPASCAAAIPSADSGKERKAPGKDKKELEKVEKKIATLEAEQKALHATMADPVFWNGDPELVEAARTRLATVEAEIGKAYERWASLGG